MNNNTKYNFNIIIIKIGEIAMVLKVCVGSSCHLKGSYDVIEKLKKIIKKYDVEDVVDLQASFCLGHCSEGVTVKADDKFLFNVNEENIEDIFVKDILPELDV